MNMLVFAVSVFFVFDVSFGDDDIMLHENWHLLPSLDECGIVTKKASRIVGGEESGVSQFPWMAQLGYKERDSIKFKCGAALINDRYVVTAAHCTLDMEKILVVVRLGANLVGLPMRCTPDSCPTVVDIPVGKIITHPAFNQTNLYNDIALIRLEHAVNETEFIHTICFPRENFFEKSFYGEKLTVAGWGRDDSSGERTALSLRHVELPMRDRCACDANYAPLKLEESQFCVGYDYGGDSCDGDSGGPLMYFDERGTYRERCYILGLVSFGKSECGDSPSVYTNTMAFLDWILDNIVGDESDTSNPQDTQNNNHTC